MTRRIFYHTDHDGEASGAIAYNWANTVATPYQACVLYPITYGKPFPFDQIHEGDSVYILDYSIPPADMKKLLAITPNVVWIDHHKTAIEEYSYHPEIGEIAGIRDTDEAGCVLTWAFFNGRGGNTPTNRFNRRQGRVEIRIRRRYQELLYGASYV